MTTYREALRKAETKALEANKEPSAIKRLLLHCSGFGSAELVASLDATMPLESERAFVHAVREYLGKHRPIQHIIGHEHFFGRRFLVNEHVLIPRYETEELVEHVLYAIVEHFPPEEPLHVLDVGTGSGCIAITLSLERERTRVTATDVSAKALEVAQENQRRLGGEVVFKAGHLLKPVRGETFDVVVANPPYIREAENLEALVKDHEPPLALFGGIDGLCFYREIVAGLPKLLARRHLVAFEHGSDQAEAIGDIIRKHFPKAKVSFRKDIAKKDRMTFFTNP